jgi:hypothetical protein
MVHSNDGYTLKRDQYYEPVAEYIVVEGAEELGREEGRKSALAEQRKLAGS